VEIYLHYWRGSALPPPAASSAGENRMTDIVIKLRTVGEDYDFHENALVYEAANEIESLRHELAECEKVIQRSNKYHRTLALERERTSD
jgi:hypothetical protein